MPIALIRKQRCPGDDWFLQSTWLGGLPTLGNAAWPRGRNGQPLHHIARIDLKDIKSMLPDLLLPDAGSLSFFFSEVDNRSEGAALFSPPGENAKTSSPEDLLPAFEEGGHTFPGVQNSLSRYCFPYWPLEAIGLDLPSTIPNPSLDYQTNQLIRDAQLAAIHAQYPERRTDFGVEMARQASIEQVDTLWWHGAIWMRENLAMGQAGLGAKLRSTRSTLERYHQFAARLEKTKSSYARDTARYAAELSQQQAYLTRLERAESLIDSFTRAFDYFVEGRDPWEKMIKEEIIGLDEFRETIWKDLNLVYQGVAPHSLDSIRNVSIERLMTESELLFAKLPESLVKFINTNYRTPTHNFHHMFGLGADVQEAPYRHYGDHLLLQIAFDSLAQMRFGDVGVVQFWISPDDLSARRWNKVTTTFEGH